MLEYDELARAAENAGNEVFWFGATSTDQIDRLEALLGARLPGSFRRFLAEYGGGGIVSAEVSGIEENDAENDSGGTVLGDTVVCRSDYGLPHDLVVMYFHDNEVCWCLDTSRFIDDECPVVSYSLFTKKVEREISDNFEEFMKQHLGLYGAN